MGRHQFGRDRSGPFEHGELLSAIPHLQPQSLSDAGRFHLKNCNAEKNQKISVIQFIGETQKIKQEALKKQIFD